MAKLSIKTELDSVVVCGQFCDWKMDKAVRLYRNKGAKFINMDNMPKGEYRIFASKSMLSGEIYTTDGRQMHNRYFNGEINEVITCYFK